MFSAILSILCETNTYPACEIFLNILIVNKIDFSTSAINSYIDYLCRNNFLEECHELLSKFINYCPEYIIPEKILFYLKEKYGENHKEDISQIIKKKKMEMPKKKKIKKM